MESLSPKFLLDILRILPILTYIATALFGTYDYEDNNSKKLKQRNSLAFNICILNHCYNFVLHLYIVFSVGFSCLIYLWTRETNFT